VPEGDTIVRTAATLRPALAGKPLVRFEAPRLHFSPFPAGTTVRGVESRGKHLLIGFDDGRVLHTHLQMSGSWHVYRPHDRWRRPPHQLRALIEVPDAVAVCFNAPTVELLRERDLARHAVLASLGPDLCAPDVDLEEVLARLGRLPPETEVGVALLDQRVACGVGNVYKSETLFAVRVDPFAPLSALDGPSRRAVYRTASDLLRRNLAGGRRVTAPGGVAVYRRAGRPCPRCGTRIRSRRQGESARATYWCPSCQASPVPAASR
jgi:endonuclease-8